MNTILLNGEWKLASGELELPAMLPGDNYSALLDAKLIPDPYYGTNEDQVQAYRKRPWTYSRAFNVPADFLSRKYIYLLLTSVDTYFTCFINGSEVCSGSSQFEVYRPEVRTFLKEGENTIEFKFEPVEEHTAELRKSIEDKLPCFTADVENMNWVRKTACHGGWDWGITLLVTGVYDDIALFATDCLRLDYLYTEQVHNGDGSVDVKAIAQVFAAEPQDGEVDFEFNGEKARVRRAFDAGDDIVTAVFHVAEPKLWWPNGYGEHPLYDLSAKVGDCKKNCKVGLRKLEIINGKDQWGTSLGFKVNGVTIFAKGGDWIPCDAMPQRQTQGMYENLLESMCAANMNMVRVWGGGQYEKECFYEICDRKGLLVWQDMMFSCAVYTDAKWFTDAVEREIKHQVRRLRSHASIVIWCGDNECQGTARWDGDKRSDKFMKYFFAVNDVEAKAVAESDQERVFWPSSPCAGPGTDVDCWSDDTSGDMHYWQVWHGSKPFESYYDVQPRFCSEFGYEAYPSMELIDRFCPQSEKNIFSVVMDKRQKCRLGNAPILSMFDRYFRFPEGLSGFLYLSQLQQALAIKTGVEYWRSTRPRCLGTMFWQINDDWPTISWSSIEYGGKWKQLQYHARRFYAPVMSTVIRREGMEPALYTVSDLPGGAQVELKVTAWNFGGRMLGSCTYNFRLEAGQSLRCADYQEGTMVGGVQDEDIVFQVETKAVAEDGRIFVHRNASFRTIYKRLRLEEPELHLRFEDDTVVLACRKPAVFVNIDTRGLKGYFEDNSFCLFPGQERRLRYLGDGGRHYSADELREHCQVMHLGMTY